MLCTSGTRRIFFRRPQVSLRPCQALIDPTAARYRVNPLLIANVKNYSVLGGSYLQSSLANGFSQANTGSQWGKLSGLFPISKIGTIQRFYSRKLQSEQPQLALAFTCKCCNERSGHIISKQAYTSGTVLVECPQCRNRHLIADHLRIFSDSSITVEDLLRERGETVSGDLVWEQVPDGLKQRLLSIHQKEKIGQKTLNISSSEKKES